MVANSSNWKWYKTEEGWINSPVRPVNVAPSSKAAKRRQRRSAMRRRHPSWVRLDSSDRIVREKRRVTFMEIQALKKDPCFWCGGPGGTVDHVIPIARGGRHAIGNLVGCCEPCNNAKGDMLPIEFKILGRGQH